MLNGWFMKEIVNGCNRIGSTGYLCRMKTTGWKKRERRAVSLILVLALLAGSLVGAPAGAADAVSYQEYSGGSWPELEFTEKSVTEYRTADGASGDVTWGTAGEETFYVVKGDVEIAGKITIEGQVKVILCDGCTLTVGKGVNVRAGMEIYLYGQTEGSGTLIVTEPEDGQAGIGGKNGEAFTWTTDYGFDFVGEMGRIWIHGGVIRVKGGKEAPGIGGGADYSSAETDIGIYGGSIEATGGVQGAGIGSKSDSAVWGPTIEIAGGAVTATGGADAPGLGNISDVIGVVWCHGGRVTARGQGAKAAVDTGVVIIEDCIATLDGGQAVECNYGMCWKGGIYTLRVNGIPDDPFQRSDSIDDELGNCMINGTVYGTYDSASGGFTSGGVTVKEDAAVEMGGTVPADTTLIVAAGKKLSFAGSLDVAGTCTVDGILTAESIRVTDSGSINHKLVLDDGSGTEEMVTAAYGSTLPAVTKPEKSGQVFLGYFTEADGKGIRYYDEKAAGQACDRDLLGISRLYAAWEDIRTVRILAGDKKITAGEALPSLDSPAEGTDYTVDGLKEGDILGKAPVLVYEKDGEEVTPDTGRAGTYDIVPRGAALPEDALVYAEEILYQKGTLTIEEKEPESSPSASVEPVATTAAPVRVIGPAVWQTAVPSAPVTAVPADAADSVPASSPGLPSGENTPAGQNGGGGTAGSAAGEGYTDITTEYADGTKVTTTTTEREDGGKETTTVRESPDGTKETTVIKENPDGSRETSTTRENPDGSRETSTTRENPDGSRETSTTRENLDGSRETSTTREDTDGRKETTVIMESTDGRKETTVITENQDGTREMLSVVEDAAGRKEISDRQEKKNGLWEQSTVVVRADGKTEEIIIEEKTAGGETTIVYPVKADGSLRVKKVTTTEQECTVPGKVTPADGTTYPVTEISPDAFRSEQGLLKVVLGDQIEKIGKRAFQNCQNLKTVRFPKGLKEIAADAFRNCGKLSSVSLSSLVQKVGKRAFMNCKSLRKFTLGTSGNGAVKGRKKGMAAGAAVQITISARALENCVRLRVVVINSQVKKIGNAAFRYCKNLGKIIIYSLVLKIVGKKALTGVHDCKIRVPSVKIKPYKLLFKNKGQGKKVVVSKL